MSGRIFCLFAALLLGCSCAYSTRAPEAVGVNVVPQGAIVVDGILDEPAWRGATVYQMECSERSIAPETPARVREKYRNERMEAGTVRFLCDGAFLYVAAELTDSDVVQYANQDQTNLYGRGDVFELFLKPEKSEAYWEFHLAPNGKRSSYLYLKRGYPRAEPPRLETGFRGAVAVDGTLNDFRDEDKMWRLEAAIPLEALAKTGRPFVPEEPWLVLAARYNYGYRLARKQNSTFPRLPLTAFHYYEYYAPIKQNTSQEENAR